LDSGHVRVEAFAVRDVDATWSSARRVDVGIAADDEADTATFVSAISWLCDARACVSDGDDEVVRVESFVVATVDTAFGADWRSGDDTVDEGDFDPATMVSRIFWLWGPWAGGPVGDGDGACVTAFGVAIVDTGPGSDGRGDGDTADEGGSDAAIVVLRVFGLGGGVCWPDGSESACGCGSELSWVGPDRIRATMLGPTTVGPTSPIGCGLACGDRAGAATADVDTVGCCATSSRTGNFHCR
jgi:hypothetical protein